MKPQIYIANITVTATTKVRGNRTDSYDYNIESYPILLLQGKIASSKSAERIYTKVYKTFINKKTYADYTFRIKKIDKAKYSSEISYIFDKTIH